jgi:hypothetical protein
VPILQNAQSDKQTKHSYFKTQNNQTHFESRAKVGGSGERDEQQAHVDEGVGHAEEGGDDRSDRVQTASKKSH